MQAKLQADIRNEKGVAREPPRNSTTDVSMLGTPVMPVPAIAMSLNQVARAGARSCSNQCALSATDHRAANSADAGAD